MVSILIIKTAALGDVLRTTSILPGLLERYRGARITWVTAPGAVDLVRGHPLVSEVVAVDPSSPASPASIGTAEDLLSRTKWERVLSFDDEEPLCRLASGVHGEQLSGAFLRQGGTRDYTSDVAPWFDMGLLSHLGKGEADLLKIKNTKSHPAIYAEMLGIAPGKPELPLPESSQRFAEKFAREQGFAGSAPIIGLNTGAGGRWHSKTLSVERTAELVFALQDSMANHAAFQTQFAGTVPTRSPSVVVSEGSLRSGGNSPLFLLLGGPGEAERNAAILRAIGGRARVVDTGTDNRLLDFAALVGLCTVLVTSDSLALHLGLARDVRIVAFFAPTSAAEIELYGLGEKVRSTSPDYCSYLPDAVTSTVTVTRIHSAVVRQLACA